MRPSARNSDAVGVARGDRVVGDHHDRLAASRVTALAHERRGSRRRVRASRLPVGSSAKMISGRLARARAHGDALLLAAGQLGRAVLEPVARGRRCRSTVSSHSWSGLRPARSIGSVMFSIAVSVGTRLNAWKMKPTRVAAQLGELLVVERGEVDVADEHRPAGERVEAGEAVHQRRLARAGRAHDGGELAGGKVDADGVEGDDLGVTRAVDLGQTLGSGCVAAGSGLRCRLLWLKMLKPVEDMAGGRGAVSGRCARSSCPVIVVAWDYWVPGGGGEKMARWRTGPTLPIVRPWVMKLE